MTWHGPSSAIRQARVVRVVWLEDVHDRERWHVTLDTSSHIICFFHSVRIHTHTHTHT